MGTTKTTVRGFGFDPSVSEHHFQVSIAKSVSGVVQISEHTSWQKDALDKSVRAVKSDDDSRLRVVLTREKWDVIADVVQNEFNRRLRQIGQKRGAWKARGRHADLLLFPGSLARNWCCWHGRSRMLTRHLCQWQLRTGLD